MTTHLLHRLVTLVIAVIIRIAIIAIAITVIAVIIVVAARIAPTTGEKHAGALGELGFGLDLLALVVGRSEGLLVRRFRIGTATEEGHCEVVCGFGFERVVWVVLRGFVTRNFFSSSSGFAESTRFL